MMSLIAYFAAFRGRRLLSLFPSPRRELSALFTLLVVIGEPLRAQDLEHVEPPAVPQLVSPGAGGSPQESPPELIGRAGALAGEQVVLSQLKGIVFLTSPNQVQPEGVPKVKGFDVSRVPLLRAEGFDIIPRSFLNQPASQQSLSRLTVATRVWLGGRGYTYISVYLPEQDITDGVVQIVVEPSRVSGPVQVEGAKWFSSTLLSRNIRQQEGDPIDTDQLKADVDWLNRNPFRRVNALALAGPERGTTVLKLEVVDRFPMRFNTGYQNTGSTVSDEDRIFAGFTWSNALGRGDQLGYQFTASPDLDTSVAHSFNYAMDLPWRHTLRLSGLYSTLDGRVAAPLTLSGTSWQIALRYDIPLGSSWKAFDHQLSLGSDFKASDNNLLFATIPVTDNLTHIFQAIASYDASLSDKHGITTWGVILAASPGGLSDRNKGRFFDISRAGAKASYFYGRLRASRRQRLPLGFTWAPRVQIQMAGGNLLGSEQASGGGSGSVRGYEEGEVYGDNLLMFSHELILPPLPLLQNIGANKLNDALQLFVFQDIARLSNVNRLAGERNSTTLHSVGTGFRYNLQQNLTANFTYGWQLKDSGSSRSGDNSRAHIYVQTSF